MDATLIQFCIFALILLTFLIALSVIDIREYRLPDRLTAPLILLGFLQAYFLRGDIINSLIGAVSAYALFWVLETSYRRLRGKEGLGRGDAKLLAAGGAWCGWFGLPFIVLIASAGGLIFASMPAAKRNIGDGPLPFGPFLALGIFMVWTALNYVYFGSRLAG